MKKILLTLTTVAVMALMQPTFANSEMDPEDIIKYRQDIMTIIKHHNSSIKAIVEGKVPYNSHLDMHMGAMEALFAELGNLFPEGSDFGDTSAKDEVWDQPEKFSKTIKEAQDALAHFKKVAAQGNMAKSAAARKKFSKASCGGCHKPFRKKDD